MRYSTEPRFRKYVKGYVFLSFTSKVGNKYGKKLMDIAATKTGMDTAKTASKRVFKKLHAGDFITDKITSIGKPKEKEKTKENTKEENRRKLYFTRKKATNY